jgi:hypothetical protein
MLSILCLTTNDCNFAYMQIDNASLRLFDSYLTAAGRLCTHVQVTFVAAATADALLEQGIEVTGDTLLSSPTGE